MVRRLRAITLTASALAASAWLATAGAWLGSARADAGPWPVRIGDRDLPAAELERAVAGCEARAATPLATPHLARCLGGEPAFAWLLDRSDAASRLATSPNVRRQQDDVLARALLDRLYLEAPRDPAALAAAEAQAQSLSSKPARIRLFRILVDDEAKARELLKGLKPDLTPRAWRELCRAQSLDQATRERGGDLGFVAADGSTDVPEVAAEPALFAAAEKVQDGQFVPVPIAETGRFAVVWRRGSLPAQQADAATVSVLAEQSERRRSGAEQQKQLLARLRAQGLRDHQPDRLGLLRGAGRMFPLQ
ncbi:MAG TPA: hypothetical protein VLC09_04650 [Polyangiaceae bacterium]|nr:hypothetical protein [Polyangiaceae bacterium]